LSNGSDTGRAGGAARHDEADFAKKLAAGADVTAYREVLDVVAGLVMPIGVQVEILRRNQRLRSPDVEAALDRISDATSKVAALIARVRFHKQRH